MCVTSDAPLNARGHFFGSRIAGEHLLSFRGCAERGEVDPRLAETDAVRPARCVGPSVATVVIHAVVLPATHHADLVVPHVQQREIPAAVARLTRALGML